MNSFSQSRLYTFVDTAYLRGRPPQDVARELCDGGSDIIQLRAKHSTPDEIRAMAEVILPITQAAGVPLVINDHYRLALQLRAPVCHLGQEDFFDAGFKLVDQLAGCPRQIQVGLSTHAPAQAQRAIAARPDYIAIGPIFATPTKPGSPPVTLEYVRWAAGNVRLPWFAIGGITLENLDDVLAACARRICVVSAILNAPDIASACRQFKQRLPDITP